MLSLHSTLARMLLLAAIAPPTLASTAQREVILEKDGCTVTVIPETLQTSIQSPGCPRQGISAAQSDLGPTENLVHSPDAASWSLPKQHVEISMRLADGTLCVQIRSSGPGTFTWPVVDLAPPARALIWPHWEGRFIPLDDAEWRAFLAEDEWNTLEGLCMPFWGVYCGDSCLTYIATNRFNNAITFPATGPAQLRFRHDFPATEKEWVYGFAIALNKGDSPVEPARQFRDWLMREKAFVPMRDKLRSVPRTERLLGAPHIYLWGDSLLSRHDIKPAQWRSFCSSLVQQANAGRPSVGARVRTFISPEAWKQVEQLAATEWGDKYLKTQVADGLSRVLPKPEFYEEAAWRSVDLPAEAKALLARRAQLNETEVCRLNALLLRAAFPNALLPVDDWGDGVSLKMLRALKEAGLERARLCLPGWEGVERRPEVAKRADEMGYLFGTYDSFHSIHDPKLAGSEDTWTTAQFNRELFENGPIVGPGGQKRGGFKKRGYLLSPQAARPEVERRVRRNMAQVPYSHYFVDCDAFGQVYDDYSPLHPCTQAQDAAARVDRLRWIGDTFRVAIGSEGGSSYAAPAVHLVEGMLSPSIGWGDAEMADRTSQYFVGGYYPPDGPRVFFQPVPLKDKYVRLHYDPRFRLPLNEIVFHDSFVSTHHWGSASLKFSNVRDTVALTELLYGCPPLYHLNLDELKAQREWIRRQYAFFSPLHRQVGFAVMKEFEWLTPDRLVQRTVFDGGVQVIANFGEAAFTSGGLRVPPRSVLARFTEGAEKVFTPTPTASAPAGN